MRGRKKRPVPGGRGLGAAVLAGSYTLGVVLGTLYARGVDKDSLTESLCQSLSAVESGSFHQQWLPLVWRCVRLPGAALLCGFSLLGLVLIPCMLGAEGFSLAFSVSAFLQVYGGEGLLPALAAFGLGSLVGVYLLLLIGGGGWSHVLGQATGRGGPRGYPIDYPINPGTALTAVALLALQITLERFAVLPMLSAALGRL